MSRQNTTLVIGIGNPLRGDDGAGWSVARRIDEQSLPGVHVMMVQQLTPELAPAIAAAERVVFIDAALADEPAQPHCQPVELSDFGMGMTHHLEPGRVCALARAIYGSAPVAHVVTVPIHAAGFGDRLSADAQRQADAAIEIVLTLIDRSESRGNHSRF